MKKRYVIFVSTQNFLPFVSAIKWKWTSLKWDSNWYNTQDGIPYRENDSWFSFMSSSKNRSLLNTKPQAIAMQIEDECDLGWLKLPSISRLGPSNIPDLLFNFWLIPKPSELQMLAAKWTFGLQKCKNYPKALHFSWLACSIAIVRLGQCQSEQNRLH